jgi:hypothetical protein
MDKEQGTREQRWQGLRLAHLCVDQQVKCWQASRYLGDLFASGRREAKAAIDACSECGRTCSAVADICLARRVPGAALLVRCIDECNACAEGCESLRDERLLEVVESCRLTGKACQDLASALESEDAAGGLPTYAGP